MRAVKRETSAPIDFWTHQRGRWRAQVTEKRIATSGWPMEGAPFMPGRAGMWLANLSADPLLFHHSNWHELRDWFEIPPHGFVVMEGPDIWTAAPQLIGKAGQAFRIGQWLAPLGKPDETAAGLAKPDLQVLFAARPDRSHLTVRNLSDSVLVIFEATSERQLATIQANATWTTQPGEAPTGDLLIRSPLHDGGDYIAKEA